MTKIFYIILIASISIILGCATVSKQPTIVEAPVSKKDQQQAQSAQINKIPEAKRYKRKIASQIRRKYKGELSVLW